MTEVQMLIRVNDEYLSKGRTRVFVNKVCNLFRTLSITSLPFRAQCIPPIPLYSSRTRKHAMALSHSVLLGQGGLFHVFVFRMRVWAGEPPSGQEGSCHERNLNEPCPFFSFFLLQSEILHSLITRIFFHKRFYSWWPAHVVDSVGKNIIEWMFYECCMNVKYFNIHTTCDII